MSNYLAKRISREDLTVIAPWCSKPVHSSHWWWSMADTVPWVTEAHVSFLMGHWVQAPLGHPSSWAGTEQRSSPDKTHIPSPWMRTPLQKPASPCIYHRSRRVARKLWRCRVTPCKGNNCCQNIHMATTHWASSVEQDKGCTVCQVRRCQRLAHHSCRSCLAPAKSDELTNSCTDSQGNCSQ